MKMLLHSIRYEHTQLRTPLFTYIRFTVIQSIKKSNLPCMSSAASLFQHNGITCTKNSMIFGSDSLDRYS